MTLHVEYIQDEAGRPESVKLPVDEWEKLMERLQRYEQAAQVRADLREAFTQVERMREGKISKQSLSDFLNEV